MVVKPTSVDGICGATLWESRTLPVFIEEPQETKGFSIIIRKCQLKKYLDIYVILE